VKTLLFAPLKIRSLEFKNRIAVSPMCEYSAKDGVPNQWHMVHLGSRAVGGAGLVITEATGVSAVGRISPQDTGIWSAEQIKAFKEITDFIKAQNSIPGIQIAHAGRKASTFAPWDGDGEVPKEKGGWVPLAPSAIPFTKGYPSPKEMDANDIKTVREEFSQAARNSLIAGFQVAEIHMAHGYLLNEFLSPLSNKRSDEFGGTLENRMRFPLQIAKDLREIWPQEWPLFVRISATDWVDGGWTLEDSVVFAKKLKDLGIDLIDCSSGGSSPDAKIKSGPGYQVFLSEGVKQGAEIATAAVGIITEAQQAEDILQSGKADMILMAREFLRDPYWPLHAAKALGEDIEWPKQYARAKR
jgi:2,4-dienoyl-CoA reductase-like NADH-dependent reductase (Old Yellow Enzyme family)